MKVTFILIMVAFISSTQCQEIFDDIKGLENPYVRESFAAENDFIGYEVDKCLERTKLAYKNFPLPSLEKTVTIDIVKKYKIENEDGEKSVEKTSTTEKKVVRQVLTMSIGSYSQLNLKITVSDKTTFDNCLVIYDLTSQGTPKILSTYRSKDNIFRSLDQKFRKENRDREKKTFSYKNNEAFPKVIGLVLISRRAKNYLDMGKYEWKPVPLDSNHLMILGEGVIGFDDYVYKGYRSVIVQYYYQQVVNN
ncbi:hypothetical protein [Candidatus Uabimicrobium amorphum]|uniref:Uncharacterized protein n=1 Tax=Uabimicrobium amorphum TaxID=2596890 RepID=A0A5S9IMW5_UABAM|nr:hypothetical protein [Candidatus Uabimicrobium amorphum]BBM84460.1 hypothetical protein UABAM_02821 [Candidatus Uabimicrobium amorphum]